MANRLRTLDYSVAQQCMHCGLCLPHCPTYDATHVERHSPRGRIALMRAIADGQMETTRVFAEEMYFCVGCLACATACPAGVNYAMLLEEARAEAEESGVLRQPGRNLIRALALRWLFLDLRRLRLLARLIRLWQGTGLQSFLRHSGIPRLLPRRWRELEAMTPEIRPHFSADLIPPVWPAVGERRHRVALLTGCAQDVMFSDVNYDTAFVLAQNGCEVVTPPEQPCCGSLHAHNGDQETARELARRNMDQFPPEQFDAIISNAGGCGSHLRHYGRLLADDPAYCERAEIWDKKLRDIHEWLAVIGVQPPRGGAKGRMTVAYHESCHLRHGQKITAPPRQVLRSLPNVELVELPESDWCCGSAGIYNLLQPEMAGQLLERKLNHIASTGASIVATGNPGCLAYIAAGLRRRKMAVRLVHPVTLLAEAYRAGPLYP